MAPHCQLTLRPNTCTLSSTVSLPMAAKRLSLDERGWRLIPSSLLHEIFLRGTRECKSSQQEMRGR